MVGCGTGGASLNLEISGHAYAILGAYTVTLDNGTVVNLIRYFNPWHSEVWATNPWNESNAVWTPNVISQVPYVKGNDGITFSSVPDFMRNFGNVQWAEVRDNYDVGFIDLSLNFDDKLFHLFKFNFTYFGEKGNDIYVFVDQSDDLITGSCKTPVFVSSLTVTQLSNGNVYQPIYYNVASLKISNASNGTYTVSINAAKNHTYVKYFTVTSYSQAGSINFINPDSTANASYQANCPNSCSLQGRCNTKKSATTTVALALNLTTSKLTTAKLNKNDIYQQWKYVTKYSDCKNNCSGKGVCSYSTGTKLIFFATNFLIGKCICGTGYVGSACELEDAPVECPNNCSGRGTCSKATG